MPLPTEPSHQTQKENLRRVPPQTVSIAPSASHRREDPGSDPREPWKMLGVVESPCNPSTGAGGQRQESLRGSLASQPRLISSRAQ